MCDASKLDDSALAPLLKRLQIECYTKLQESFKIEIAAQEDRDQDPGSNNDNNVDDGDDEYGQAESEMEGRADITMDIESSVTDFKRREEELIKMHAEAVGNNDDDDEVELTGKFEQAQVIPEHFERMARWGSRTLA